MKEIGLVSCTKTKHDYKATPKDLYMKSDLFKKMRAYCERYHNEWYILSAKYYLLEPDGDKIEPYDETLRGAKAFKKKEWSKKVFEQLRKRNLLSNTLIIHAGKDYYQYLLPLLKENNVQFKIPTQHLGIGQKKAWYKKKLKS